VLMACAPWFGVKGWLNRLRTNVPLDTPSSRKQVVDENNEGDHQQDMD